MNNENVHVKEETSLVVTKNGSVTQECIKSNSLFPSMPKLTRKSTAPRFLSPLQGKIVDQGADVELEGVIDGMCPKMINKNGALR